MGKYDDLINENEEKKRAAQAEAEEASRKRKEAEKAAFLEASRTLEELVRPELSDVSASLGKAGRNAAVSDEKATHRNYNISYTSALRIEVRSSVTPGCKLEFLIGGPGAPSESSIIVKLWASNQGNIVQQDYSPKSLTLQKVEGYIQDFINLAYDRYTKPHGT